MINRQQYQKYTFKFLPIVILVEQAVFGIYRAQLLDLYQVLQNQAIIITLNGMSKSQPKQDNNCEHDYCPHLHFQKCRKYRQTNIPFTYRPSREIDMTCNRHIKTFSELKTTNISTLAVERYLQNPILPDQEETNFTKNFYLQNIPDNFQLRNTMIKDLEQEIQTKNAYVLAISARKEYQKFAKQRQDYLQNARKRADIEFNRYYENKRIDKQKQKEELKRWITEYYRKVEELIEHIFAIKKEAQEDPTLKDRIFIKENQGNDSKKLASLKIKDPAAALGVLQSLRALLLVKKMQLQQVRKDLEHNKSGTVSQIDTTNTSQQKSISGVSFISATSNGTNTQGESHFAQKYCDFQSLKKKWGKNNVQQIRDILRLMSCRDMVNKAEGFQMRQKRLAKQKDQFLKKQMQKMLGKKNVGGKQKKGKGKNQNISQINHQEEAIEEKKVIVSTALDKQEEIVKQTLLKGGIFDSLGNKYQRNRNYSQLFKNRAQTSEIQLSFRESSELKQRPSTARTKVR